MVFSTVPGFKVVGVIATMGPVVICDAVRERDGARVLMKTSASMEPPTHVRNRLRRESAILERLADVPGVLRPVSFEVLRGQPTLVAERVEGTSLAEFVKTPLPIPRLLDIAIRLCSILAAVHGRGVIHKNLRPSGILVTPKDEIVLLDFGVATLQHVEHADASPASLLDDGSIAYISPEQTGRMNRAVDERSDLYSLGVTLYELLTGDLPFHGGDALEWCHAHMTKAPKPPSDGARRAPAALSAIVMKLLAKVAEERYQSAAGVKADLERCRDQAKSGDITPFPLAQRDVPVRFNVPQKLYGREADIAALEQAFERVARGGRAELVLVSGYSGIGKSSVVHELHRHVVERRGFFLSGKFDQMQRDVPYATIAQAIRGLTQELLSCNESELATWRRQLDTAWEDAGRVVVDLVPQLELVVGKQKPVPVLPPNEAQNRFHRVFQAFLGVFARPERPLVLFLDDLQWTDLASLKLLQKLVTNPQAPPVLFIGAYRDNEVNPSHPLSLTLTEIRRAQARVTDIRLAELTPAQTAAFVADALRGSDDAVIRSLAEILHAKTGGNPFFLIRYLMTLHQDGLLYRGDDGRYRCDADRIAKKGYSENVVDFMVGRLRRLPQQTQHLLRLSACAGNAFALSTLAIISDRTEAEVESGLEEALHDGLIARGATDEYRFLHDRIQQAAYALIPEEDRKAVHLRIGRILLEKLSQDEVRERVFDVVQQLNAGASLIDDPAERHRLARLNAEAGRRAQAATAHRSAVVYYETALALLDGDPWQVDYALTLCVQLDRARSESMTGNAVVARRLVDEVLSRTRTRAEKAAAYRVKVELLVALSENDAAVACVLECLALFDVHIAPHPTLDDVLAANEEVWRLLGARPIESLIDLPQVQNPDVKEILDTLAVLFSPAYFTDGNLLILHLCRMVSLSIQYGNSEAAAHGYAWYGVVAGPVFKKYTEAYTFGRVACDLVERNDYSASRGKALYSMEIIHYWTKPISGALDLIRNAFHYAAQAGDFQIACYACNHIVTDRISLGHPLDEVYAESIARWDFARNVGFRDVCDIILPAQRYAQNLRGLSRAFGSLDGDGFDERKFEAELTPDRMVTMICWYHLIKAQARYMAGDFEGALAPVREAEARIWASLAHIQLLDYHIFRPLILAANLSRASEDEQRKYLESMEQDRRQLDEWATYCPENFRCAERMVAGEIARVSNRPCDALRAFEEAIVSASDNGYVQHVGLAHELSARMSRALGLSTAALAHARLAREAYARWGADAKVRALDTEWKLSPLEPLPPQHAPAVDAAPSNLDVLSLVKAQQAVSSELVLSQLTATLLRVAMENAGADRGALLLQRGDDLSIEVAADMARPEGSSEVRASIAHDLLWAAVAYVKRSRDRVLIGDTSKPHPLVKASVGSSIRSVLCIPVQRKGDLQGILYLENNLVTHAFTPDQIVVLEQIASQAAISIENARLYGDIQEKLVLIEQQNDTIRTLATPVMKVWSGVLCLPILGIVDSRRAADIMAVLLDACSRESARVAIIDLTGVEVIDTATANHLIQLVRAASLLGVEGILSGIQAAVAQTIVALGVNLQDVRTERSLESALKRALARTGSALTSSSKASR